jgi:hypothetical protein
MSETATRSGLIAADGNISVDSPVCLALLVHQCEPLQSEAHECLFRKPNHAS